MKKKLYFEKEMEYISETKMPECIAMGDANGVQFAVVSLGTHPCGYIRVDSFMTETKTLWESFRNELTYGPKEGPCALPGIWIGWDHAHSFCDDFVGDNPYTAGGKKWTTEEVVQECVEAIRDLFRQAVADA